MLHFLQAGSFQEGVHWLCSSNHWGYSLWSSGLFYWFCRTLILSVFGCCQHLWTDYCVYAVCLCIWSETLDRSVTPSNGRTHLVVENGYFCLFSQISQQIRSLIFTADLQIEKAIICLCSHTEFEYWGYPDYKII